MCPSVRHLRSANRELPYRIVHSGVRPPLACSKKAHRSSSIFQNKNVIGLLLFDGQSQPQCTTMSTACDFGVLKNCRIRLCCSQCRVDIGFLHTCESATLVIVLSVHSACVRCEFLHAQRFRVPQCVNGTFPQGRFR